MSHMDNAELIDYTLRVKYIVVTTNGLCTLFTSMREISQLYKLDHSTISKALQKNTVCVCKTKELEHICIRALHV